MDDIEQLKSQAWKLDSYFIELSYESPSRFKIIFKLRAHRPNQPIRFEFEMKDVQYTDTVIKCRMRHLDPTSDWEVISLVRHGEYHLEIEMGIRWMIEMSNKYRLNEVFAILKTQST